MPIPPRFIDLADMPPGMSLEDFAAGLYALLGGRSGGQTLIGGTGSGETLTLKGSTLTGVSQGSIILFDPVAMTDQAGDPSSAGRLQRNAALLKFHDGTAVRTLLTSLDATATPTASKIPIADVSGKLAAAWLSEVLALADLSDVTSKTGTGTVAVMDTSPTIVTPTIASMVNANHNHRDAAGGGTLDHGLALTGLSDDDHAQYALLAGRAAGQTISGGDGIGGGSTLTLKGIASGSGGSIVLADAASMSDLAANPTVTGRFQRNGANLKWHDGTASRTLAHDATALGGHASGTLGAVVIQDGTTSQKGIVQLDADNGEVITRAVNGQDTRLVRRGTSFPASPADGWHYYRTDLDELFQYDGTRSKWLSQRVFTYEGAHTAVNNTYLNMPGGPVFSSTIGFYVPFDMTLCEIHITNATAVTGTFRIRANGSNVNAWTQAQGSGIQTGLNDNFTAADILSFFTSSNISSGCFMKAILRRRAA